MTTPTIEITVDAEGLTDSDWMTALVDFARAAEACGHVTRQGDNHADLLERRHRVLHQCSTSSTRQARSGAQQRKAEPQRGLA